MDNTVSAFQYQPKSIISSNQVLLICLKCGFRCSLYASKSVSASPLSSTTAARKRQRTWNCILTEKYRVKIEKEQQTCMNVNLHIVLWVQTSLSEDTASIPFTLAKETAVQWKQDFQKWHVVKKKTEELLQS